MLNCSKIKSEVGGYKKRNIKLYLDILNLSLQFIANAIGSISHQRAQPAQETAVVDSLDHLENM